MSASPLNMVEVMGSLGRLLLASRFLSSRSKLLWASHPNMVDVPLSMVDVMGRARELLWASRFLNIKLPLASRLTFNMVDALSLRFPVNMVDVLSRLSKLVLASRFPLNMVDGMGSLGRILLAHRFHGGCPEQPKQASSGVRAAPSGHSCPLQADPPNMGIPSQTQPEFSKSNGKVVTYDVEKLEDAQVQGLFFPFCITSCFSPPAR